MSQNELFDLGNYSAPVPRRQKKKYSSYAVDPAWDDGTAFPSNTPSNLESRKIDPTLGENPTQDDSKNLTEPEYRDIVSTGSEQGDRWNPLYFSPINKHQIQPDGQLTIFFDSSQEPPEPDDFKSLAEFEEAWQQWEREQEKYDHHGSLTGMMDTIESRMTHESNLPALRGRIPVIQPKSEVLQPELQIQSDQHRIQPERCDRTVRDRIDTSGSSPTNGSHKKSYSKKTSGSGLHVKKTNQHKECSRNASRSRIKPQLEAGTDESTRICNGEVSWSSESNPERTLCSSTHSSNGEIFGEIPGVLRTESPRERSCPPYQSHQSGQQNRKSSVDEDNPASAITSSVCEQTSQEQGDGGDFPICKTSITNHGLEPECCRESNKKTIQSRGLLLGICLINSHNLTCVLAWALVIVTLVQSSDSSLSELQKLTRSAQTSSTNDTLESKITETSGISNGTQGKRKKNQTSLHVHRHASHSASEANDLQQTTTETAFQPCSTSLRSPNQSTAQSKTYQDCSVVQFDQESKNSTSITSPNNSQSLGTDWRALSFPVHRLEAPLSENGCCSLPSPTAYSSISSRPPGTNKLERFLREKGMIQPEEVVNPSFLEVSLGIPEDWTNPYSQQTAWEYVEEEASPEVEELHWETPLTLESHTLPLPESYISKAYEQKARGCLYKYLENKKLKDGRIVSYPRVDGERDPDNQNHWRWGFCWEEKIDGEWRNRSLGCVPLRILSMVKAMQKMDTPLAEIIRFIRQSKRST